MVGSGQESSHANLYSKPNSLLENAFNIDHLNGHSLLMSVEAGDAVYLLSREKGWGQGATGSSGQLREAVLVRGNIIIGHPHLSLQAKDTHQGSPRVQVPTLRRVNIPRHMD